MLILYEDGSHDLECVAKSICSSLKERGNVIVLKKASEVLIPDLLAASAFFLGVSSASPVGFGEIERVFRGINLSGRPAGFFVSDLNGGGEYLKKIVRDTGLVVSKRILAVSAKSCEEPATGRNQNASRKAVESWAASIIE
jgi:hypothetical protein